MNVIHIPGKINIADSLSRLSQSMAMAVAVDQEGEDIVLQLALLARPVALSLEEIKRETEVDVELGKVMNCLRDGRWLPELKRYELIENELWMVDGILMRGTRIIIPNTLKHQVLELAHEGHPGISAMKRRLRTKVWWLGIDKDGEELVKGCQSCIRVGSLNNPEPMVRRKLPERPWQDIAIDFLGPLPSGDNLLVMVDYYSRYMEVLEMRSITASKTIEEMGKVFARFGYPETLSADNGPQFKSEEFKDFCNGNGIQLNLTVPYWPQANGEVERQNRSILKILKIAEDEGQDWKVELQRFLTMHRATPHTVTGVSPSQLMFGWSIRDKLPSIMGGKIESKDEEVRDRDQFLKEKGKEYANKRRKAEMADLEVGDKVFAKNMHKSNKLSSTFEKEHYTIESKNLNDILIREENSGKLYRRAASHLKKIPDTINFPLGATPSTPESPEKTSRPLRKRREPERYQSKAEGKNLGRKGRL